MGKIERPDVQVISKGYEVGRFSIFKLNSRDYVIATSMEEAIAIYREYQEKEKEDAYRGTMIKEVELVEHSAISKKYIEPMNEL